MAKQDEAISVISKPSEISEMDGPNTEKIIRIAAVVLSLRSNSRAIRKVKSTPSARKTEANNFEKRVASSKPGWKTATMALTRNQKIEEKPSTCSEAAVRAIRPVSAKVRE